MSWKDCNKLQRAAIFWAYTKGWRVKTQIWPYDQNDLHTVRVTLVAKHRIRDFS